MIDTITERVQRGAALLDEKVPGWDDEIDLTRLNINDGSRCIGGQLGRRRGKAHFYAGMMEALGLVTPSSRADHGFCDDGRGYSLLTLAWRDLIIARRIARIPDRPPVLPAPGVMARTGAKLAAPVR
jgi:hypothetical protein